MDLGCGTGENAIMFASKGCSVLGVDLAPIAIQKARAKAEERGSQAEFVVANALHLGELGRTFDVATDCGLFHTFSDRERRLFAESLKGVLATDGRYFMLCFSDREPAGWGGPRRVSEPEIVGTFSKGWRVEYIRPARFEASHLGDGGQAWLSSLVRLK